MGENTNVKMAAGLAASLAMNLVQGCVSLSPPQPDLVDQSRTLVTLMSSLGLDRLDPREQHARIQGLKAMSQDNDLPYLLDTSYRRGRDPDSDLPLSRKIMDLHMLNARGAAGLLNREECRTRATLAIQVKGTYPHSSAVTEASKPIVLAQAATPGGVAGGDQDLFCSAR